ncbi:MAG: N-acetyltransferase family protein [Actinomycetota bacterium]
MRIRAGGPGDRAFLEAMLREAAFANEPSISVADVMARPDLAITIPDFTRPGDVARIAEEGGVPVGAAWCRRFTDAEHSWGFLDEATPELGIAVVASHRRRGIGSALLIALIGAATIDGWRALSLCTDRNEGLARFYARAGFV